MNEPNDQSPSIGRKARGRRPVHWRRDHAILARLREVERLHFQGLPNTHIAAQLGISEATIRTDLKRLQELWIERTDGEQQEIRARVDREKM